MVKQYGAGRVTRIAKCGVRSIAEDYLVVACRDGDLLAIVVKGVFHRFSFRVINHTSGYHVQRVGTIGPRAHLALQVCPYSSVEPIKLRGHICPVKSHSVRILLWIGTFNVWPVRRRELMPSVIPSAVSDRIPTEMQHRLLILIKQRIQSPCIRSGAGSDIPSAERICHPRSHKIVVVPNEGIVPRLYRADRHRMGEKIRPCRN